MHTILYLEYYNNGLKETTERIYKKIQKFN
jgi:hypothetical protein